MTAAAFITGIGGQDGTYLAERLVAEGMEVHALVLEADGPPAHCPAEVVLHTGDLGDLEATRRLVLELAPQEVYNLAAISSVAQSWDEPDLTAHVNGQAAVALMESARRLGDVEATRQLVREIAPRELYNLAAISSVAQSWDEPDRTAHVNGLAAVCLLYTSPSPRD